MMTLQEAYTKQSEVEQQIAELESDLSAIEHDPESHITSVDFDAMYDEMLDEVHGEFMGYSASRILEEVDPTAYRTGFNDWLDSYDATDSEEYSEKAEELEDLQSELEELEEEIEELESEE